MVLLEAVRRRSDPLLRRLLSRDEGDSNTNNVADAVAKAALGYEDSGHNRQTAKRRINKTNSTNNAISTTNSNSNQAQFPLQGDETILLTWKEIATGTLLLCAFGACSTVFVLLHHVDRTGASGGSASECEARNALQQKLMAFMAGDNSTAASALSLLAEGVSISAASTSLDSNSNSNDDGSCAYNVNVCPTTNSGSSEDEAIMYVLLIGALLTVVGVTVLLYDDNEGAMLKMVSPNNNTYNNSNSDLPSGSRRGSMSASETMWSSQSRTKMGNADLFPDCSVLFAGIVGFEAWSSQREPSQCLNLLETIYDALDRIARSEGIFKVESVADCYTAATGLPEPRADHAEAIIRFANDCLKRFRQVTKELEVTLGPDTSDLRLKIGIHSGPVTAIRRHSRFQLFGETVTSANKIMSTSSPGRIQMSQETVNFLPPDARTDWVIPSGEGEYGLATYWLSSAALHMVDGSNRRSSTRNLTSGESESDSDKIPRLVNWNVEILKRVLNQMAAQRCAARAHLQTTPTMNAALNKDHRQLSSDKLVIEEVEEVVKLPKYEARVRSRAHDSQVAIEISDQAVEQLREYILTIAQSYKNNPFHNFEHASHVTMSVSKLLSRILAPKLGKHGKNEKLLHDHTYGITSDPLTQFACIFSALIHDAEHEGVPNAQLVKEENPLASKYNYQSVAEQNSVDVGWNLLMETRFKDLRNAIYTNEKEMIHFRQLVVNCVMATDICDKQLKELRNNRWDRAFKADAPSLKRSASDPLLLEEDVNRKATIVIEHMLQASDVSHTMQHFHVFQKWNENLFMEMYFAFRDGRSAADPSKFWYKGEIGFYDFYIIPLAKKLKECGVFGVSSDEYLNYATKNRKEWEMKGLGIVEGLIARAEKAYDCRQNK